VCSLIEEPGEGAAIVFRELEVILFFSFFSVSGPFFIYWQVFDAPDRILILGESQVLFEILSAFVPISTITRNTSVLEVKSIVAGHACVELGLKPDDSNLMVLSIT